MVLLAAKTAAAASASDPEWRAGAGKRCLRFLLEPSCHYHQHAIAGLRKERRRIQGSTYSVLRRVLMDSFGKGTQSGLVASRERRNIFSPDVASPEIE